MNEKTERGAPIAPGLIGWVSYLVKSHRLRLARVARAEGLEEQDGLDAVQEAFETFLVLPQARDLVEDDEDSLKFLTVIVKNKARNLRRRSSRRGRIVLSSEVMEDSALDNADHDQPNAEQLILEAEQHVSLLGCLKKLKEVQRHVVTLRLFEGRDGREVADALQLTSGNVATILTRARADLRECLLEQPPTDQ